MILLLYSLFIYCILPFVILPRLFYNILWAHRTAKSEESLFLVRWRVDYFSTECISLLSVVLLYVQEACASWRRRLLLMGSLLVQAPMNQYRTITGRYLNYSMMLIVLHEVKMKSSQNVFNTLCAGVELEQRPEGKTQQIPHCRDKTHRQIIFKFSSRFLYAPMPYFWRLCFRHRHARHHLGLPQHFSPPSSSCQIRFESLVLLKWCLLNLLFCLEISLPWTPNLELTMDNTNLDMPNFRFFFLCVF